MRILPRANGLLLAIAAAAAPAFPETLDYALRSTVAFEADGKRDLGLLGGGGDNILFLNLAPRIVLEFNQSWTGYVRARLFVPTSRVSPFDSSEPDNTHPERTFAGLNEFWIQYNGFTSYPDEGLRIGRQRIRQTDNEWWDQDADAIRWIFDTTLLSAEAGIARQFSTYRTDTVEGPVSQRGRTYLFGDFATEWRAENRVGLRTVHAMDSAPAPQVGAPITPDTKLQDARLTWVGVYADNGFFSILGAEQPLSYGAEVNYLTGHQILARHGTDETVTAHQSQSVGAWEASIGMRWRPLPRVPIQFGGGYTYSEGGEHGAHSQQYQQTGMQSNTSYFTGTETLVERYNETLQAELGNLLVLTGFVSVNLADNDASVVFENFRRDSGRSPLLTDNVTAEPLNSGRDIGNGLDLVLTHYLHRVQRRQRLLDRGDAFTAQERQSLISLHASAFQPGAAYGPNARTDYRILLEVTLWVD